MIERIDRYLRSSDSFLAKTLSRVSPIRGAEYLDRKEKRTFDLVVGVPAFVASTAIIIPLALLKKLEDGDPPFFTQERIKKEGETFQIIKIRTMVRNSQENEGLKIAYGIPAEDHPGVTKLGSFMRKYHLDELPQIFQVIMGGMTLVGNRPVVAESIENNSKVWSKERMRSWIENYSKGKKGITGAYQVFGPLIVDDKSRYHFDVFYVEHASLGFDLYILWRTIRKELNF